jgi:type II restriction enzyme
MISCSLLSVSTHFRVFRKFLPEKARISEVRYYGTKRWKPALKVFLDARGTLAQRYAKKRKQKLVPVQTAHGKKFKISPGEHSLLIKAIVEDFAPRFAPGCVLVYVGDTGDKWGYFDEKLLAKLGVTIDSHGKMPDVVLYCPDKRWLLLVESVTSHGPVDGKRHAELAELFASAAAGLVYVTAFPSHAIMARYLSEIAWETEVWVSEAPSHLIHFNGPRFLGPYTEEPDN